MIKAGNETDVTKGIILVGGLGLSPYLYERLQRRYGGDNIDVLQSTGTRPLSCRSFDRAGIFLMGVIYLGARRFVAVPS